MFGGLNRNMKYQSVVVVTYGRSGSTLLQGVLNSIPGVLVKGENGGLLFDMYQMYQTLLSARLHRGAKQTKNAWFGIDGYDDEEWIRLLEAYIYRSIVGDQQDVQCYGFKEIRYLPFHRLKIDAVGSAKDHSNITVSCVALADYLAFIRKVLPDCAVVINTRNHDEVVKSAWWAEKDPDWVKSALRQFETEAAAYVKAHSHAFHVDYANVCANDDRLADLFEFLGAEYRPEAIRVILAEAHSYQSSDKPSGKFLQRQD
jgi:hypothetical protein